MKISKYFSDYEVGKSPTADRLGIDNTPPDDVMERASYHAQHTLDPIREAHGPLSPQSWYRCEALERVLTWESGFRRWCISRQKERNEESWAEYFLRKSHPKGEATDIEYPLLNNEELFAWVQAHIPSFDQLILEFHRTGKPNSGWVHTSSKEEGDRMEVFKI